jgi:hypothetical protein
MRTVQAVLIAVSIVLLSQQLAFGHGFLMFNNVNQIDTTSENVPIINHHLFSASTFAISDGYASEHGLVQADFGSGLNISSDTFRIELAGVLWYSSGGLPVKAADGVVLTGENQYTAQKVELSRDGVSPLYSGFPITGTDNHEVFWRLTGPIQPGVYGVSYRVSGLQNGNPATPYDTSDLIVVAFSTVGFSNLDAVKAVYAAATAIPGDFDLDGDVDGADLAIWQTHFSAATDAELIAGDADLDGDIDGADFITWQTNFSTAPSPASAPVPEANGLLLASLGGIVVCVAVNWRKKGCILCIPRL